MQIKTVALLPLQFECCLVALEPLVSFLDLSYPKIEVVKTGILPFLVLNYRGESFQSFIVKYDANCRFFVGVG